MMRSSSGLLNVFEDFCPQTNDTALVVTGVDYQHHTEIREARFHLEDELVVVESSRLVRSGKHLRLGNVFAGALTFSDAGRIISDVTFPSRGYVEQPFRGEDGLFYTQDSEIWLNGLPFIRRFDGYDEVCHPTVDGRWVYFEAKRVDPQFPGSAQGWQVLRRHLDHGVTEQVLDHGANPYAYGGRLYHSRWNVAKIAFETAAVPLPEVAAANGSELRGAA